MPPLFKYNSSAISVPLTGRDWNVYEDPVLHRREDVQALSGVTSFSNFSSRRVIHCNLRNAPGGFKNELEEWFNNVKDGTTFEFYRDDDLLMYVPFEGQSTDSKDDSTGTFARTGAAYVLDAYTGLFTSVATGVARFPAGKYGAGWLNEVNRTNLITHPSDLTGGAWTPANLTVTATTTEVKDPAGGNNASKLAATADGGSVFIDTGTAIGTDESAYSLWLRTPSGTKTVTIVIFEVGASTLSSDNVTVTPEWQEFEINYDNGGSSANNWEAIIQLTTNGDVVYTYGNQIEAGSGVLNATTCVNPTATSSATRNAETLSFASTGNLNQEVGTICFWMKPHWVYNEHTRADLFTSGANDSNKHLYIQVLANGNISFIGYRLNDGTQAFSVSTSANGKLTQDIFAHMAFVYDFPNGLYTISVDGVLANTSSDDSSVSSGIGTSFKLGSTIAGGAQANVTFDELAIWKRVLTQGEIQQLASRRYAFGRGRNRYSAVHLQSFKYSEKNSSVFDIDIEMFEEIT